jgi:hypothetical protein
LIPTLKDKKNYVVHYRNLQLYIELGMKITKIHRILGFHQKVENPHRLQLKHEKAC